MRATTAIALPILFAIAIGGGALSAQGPAMPTTPPGAADATRVTSGTYTNDAGHTLVGWRVNHFGFNDYFGQFGNATGTLVLDTATPANSRVDMTIPVNGLSAANAQLITHMLSADFFDVAAHPTARFVSRHVMVDGTRATIHGDLTIKGQTHPVALNAEFVGAGTNPFNQKQTVGFHATTTIKRSEFGLGYGIPLVSDDVQLTITTAFEK
ncbi:MAG: YceI family protein [Sphingopyxis sp.]